MHGDSLVKGMALLRYLSATVELAAATWMLRSGRLETAMSINALLGLFGPTLFLLVSALGLYGLSGSLPASKMVLIAGGVLLVLIGATR